MGRVWPTFKLGMLSGRTAQYFQPRLVSLLPAPLQSNSTASALGESEAAPPPPAACAAATGHRRGANPRQPVVCPVPIDLARATRKCGTHTLLESSACRKFGKSGASSWRTRQRRAEQAAKAQSGAAEVHRPNPVGFIYLYIHFWSDAVPRSLIPNAPTHFHLHSCVRELLQLSGHFCDSAECIHQNFTQCQPEKRR